PMCSLSGDCPPTWSKRPSHLSQLVRSNDPIQPYLCRSTPLNQAIIADGLVLGRGIISHAIGASEAANTTETGRIAAGWCPGGVGAGRFFWRGGRRRGGGGVRAAGTRVLPGAPGRGEHRAAGPRETAEHATGLAHPLGVGQLDAGLAPP